MEHEIRPGYGSHLPILIKAFFLTKGSVLECGTGYNSTPVLHWLCQYYKRHLRSLESVLKYYKINKPFHNKFHCVQYVDSWDSVVYDESGLVFIDCKPALQRKEIAKKLSNNAQIIVLHDSQQTNARVVDTYQYEIIYPLFRYVYHAGQPINTSVVSNFLNVADLFEME